MKKIKLIPFSSAFFGINVKLPGKRLRYNIYTQTNSIVLAISKNNPNLFFYIKIVLIEKWFIDDFIYYRFISIPPGSRKKLRRK